MEQEILNYSYAAVLAIIGWIGKTLWDAVSKLKEDLKSIEIDLPKTYVSKVDIDSRLDKIDSVLDKIFERLEHKADKNYSRERD